MGVCVCVGVGVVGCVGGAWVDGEEKEVTERQGNWTVHRGVDKFTDKAQKPGAWVFAEARRCDGKERT